MISEPVLVDTEALLALYNARDPYHSACKKQAAALPIGKVFTCWPIITEAAYMLRKHPAERDHLLRQTQQQEFCLLPLRASDVQSIRDVFDKYHDQEVDLADASLVHLAERENINAIFTLDNRHFRIYRRLDGTPFRLLPDDSDDYGK